MVGDDLTALLGATTEDPRVRLALDVYRLDPPVVAADDDEEEPDWYVWRPSARAGVEFGFQDPAHLNGSDPSQRGRDPLVLSSVCFYGAHDGVDPHSGQFPLGLTREDGRETIRRKIEPLGGTYRAHVRDTWDLQDRRIIVAYGRSGDVLGSVLVRLPLRPWPEVVDPSVVPGPRRIIDLFGQVWYSAAVKQAFGSFELIGCGPDIALHRYANLRRTAGMELLFSPDASRPAGSPLRRKGAVFSGIRMYASRYQDALAWPGELPFGLTFDESFPTLLKKMGRKPDAGDDGDLTGFGLWHEHGVSLHVLYDNVNNAVLCVSLLRPGHWIGAAG